MKKWLVSLLLFCSSTPASAQAQINPATVHVVASPDVLGWPVTTRIQTLEVSDRGIRVGFGGCGVGRWGPITPPGWAGPLTHTLWLFLNIGGEWYASGIIQFWACDQFNGGAIYQDNQIARNWVYDNRWSAMVGHQPAPGERIGFMVSAGNARGQDDHLVAERSDIVELAMPTGPIVYPPAPFLAVEGAFIPTPTPTPAPNPQPPAPSPQPPLPATDLSPVLNLLAVNQAMVLAHLAAVKTELKADVAAVGQKVDDFRAAVRSKWDAFISSPIVRYGTAVALGLLAHWGVTKS